MTATVTRRGERCFRCDFPLDHRGHRVSLQVDGEPRLSARLCRACAHMVTEAFIGAAGREGAAHDR